MAYNPALHHRRRVRLSGYDYTLSGGYFITIVTALRQPLFGEIASGRLIPTPCGEIVRHEWDRLPDRFSFVTLDAFVVMPNHIHGILWMGPHGSSRMPGKLSDDEGGFSVAAGSLAALVRAYKSSAAFQIHKLPGMHDAPVWQGRYYEHILRGDADYRRIYEYIEQNPVRWSDDQENPDNQFST